MFSIYSPELYAAQEERLLSLRTSSAGDDGSGGIMANSLVRATGKRLRLLGLSEAQIDALSRRGAAEEAVAIASPTSGFVIEKNIVEGGHVRVGQLLYRIADLEGVWAEAEVYESDLPQIEIGQSARVSLSYLPGQEFEGRVAHVYPYLEGKTRTGRIRIELSNPDFELKPEMYANVELEVDLGERLQVPESAIVYTGRRRLVFLDLGEGRLRPKTVRVGRKSGNRYEVLEGLDEGDIVVTSGNFLVAAESRIKAAVQYWGGAEDEE